LSQFEMEIVVGMKCDTKTRHPAARRFIVF